MAPKTNAETAIVPDKKSEDKDAITDAIPSEALALYTGVLIAIVAFYIRDQPSHSYVPLRWGMFAGGCVAVILWLTVLYSGADKIVKEVAEKENEAKPADEKVTTTERQPIAELAAALIAFTALALALPESPLRAQLDDNEVVIISAVTAVGAAVVVAISKKYLKAKAT